MIGADLLVDRLPDTIKVSVDGAGEGTIHTDSRKLFVDGQYKETITDTDINLLLAKLPVRGMRFRSSCWLVPAARSDHFTRLWRGVVEPTTTKSSGTPENKIERSATKGLTF